MDFASQPRGKNRPELTSALLAKPPVTQFALPASRAFRASATTASGVAAAFGLGAIAAGKSAVLNNSVPVGPGHSHKIRTPQTMISANNEVYSRKGSYC